MSTEAVPFSRLVLHIPSKDIIKIVHQWFNCNFMKLIVREECKNNYFIQKRILFRVIFLGYFCFLCTQTVFSKIHKINVEPLMDYFNDVLIIFLCLEHGSCVAVYCNYCQKFISG